MSAFKWCFIGTGTLAKKVAEELNAFGKHEISAVYSRRYEQAVDFADQYGGTAYSDESSAISHADAVYVVTPHTSHYPMVKTAIEMGKPVLCEKPFTVNADETKELFRLAKEKRVYIVEGMWTWFAPVARNVKEWLEDIGEIQQVITNYRVNVVNYAPRLTDPNLAGGALLDSGVYPITYLYRLFGKPVSVKCTGVIQNGIDLSDEIDLTFVDGRMYHISLSICDDAGIEDIRIIGSKGEIYVPHFHYADEAVLKNEGGTHKYVAETTLHNEFDLVAKEIRERKIVSEYIPPYVTIDVMEIMDECRRQIGLVYPFER